MLSPELEFAVFVDFGFGLHATRDLDNVREYALANFVDRFGPVDHSTGREIEIIRHSLEYGIFDHKTPAPQLLKLFHRNEPQKGTKGTKRVFALVYA